MTVGQCTGNTEDHCCYVDGAPCPFLVENVEGRRWACGLRVKYGNWEDVHSDPGYLTKVKPQWIKVGIVDCGEWPEPGEQCANCGVVGGEN